MWGRRMHKLAMRYEVNVRQAVLQSRFLAMVFLLFAPFVAPLVLVGSVILIGVGRGFLGRFFLQRRLSFDLRRFSFRLVVSSCRFVCRFVLLFFFSFVVSGVGALCRWFVSESRREGRKKVAGGGPSPCVHAACCLSPRACWML